MNQDAHSVVTLRLTPKPRVKQDQVTYFAEIFSVMGRQRQTMMQCNGSNLCIFSRNRHTNLIAGGNQRGILMRSQLIERQATFDKVLLEHLLNRTGNSIPTFAARQQSHTQQHFSLSNCTGIKLSVLLLRKPIKHN